MNTPSETTFRPRGSLRRGWMAAAFTLSILGVSAADLHAQGTAAQRALPILERAAERYREMSGFCADFRQIVQNDILRQTTRSRGELCQMRPDRLEMRFSDPAGDRVVADGTHLWVYLPSIDPGQAIRSNLATHEGRFDLHREFLTDPGTRYTPTLEAEETIDGRRHFILRLEPKVPSPYLQARIWVDASDSLIRILEITEDVDFVRRLELTSIRVNPTVPADRFRFTPPAGIQVVVR
jgi:outer membrane lipoprotein carrier protein